MRLLSFSTSGRPSERRLGALLDDRVLDVPASWGWAAEWLRALLPPSPLTLADLISGDDDLWEITTKVVSGADGESASEKIASGLAPVFHALDAVQLAAPISRPPSIRDFYAFEQHVKTANEIRGREIPAEWYDFPVFYFSNPNAVFGPDETIPYPASSRALDYELEIACIIKRPGINIQPEEVVDYIAGFTIFNDWSARDVQQKETRVGLGPAKAKDFASSMGPWLVTPDELIDRSGGRPGVYDLVMTARVNDEQRSHGNFKDIHYSFGELIARASRDAPLVPGDVLGSGTVGSGCLFELTRGNGPWLEPGDVVELEVDRLGILRNTIGQPRQR